MAFNNTACLCYALHVLTCTFVGVVFSRRETFGQFPLQVDGYNDIHESLDAATAHGDIETLTTDTQSGQELWFTGLPPVLTFELSRFQFNAKLSQPVKIHKKLDFPQLIYMDRFGHFLDLDLQYISTWM